MAFLTKVYVDELRNMNLIERTDFTKLSKLSRKAGIKNGKGYTRPTFSNVINKRQTTTDEVVELIKTFYDDKAKNVKQLHDSLKVMKQNLTAAAI
jgi:hypothetical protein